MKYKLVLLSMFLVLICVIIFFIKSINREVKNTNIVETVAIKVNVYQIDNKTTFTGYSLSIDETDSNPCIGSRNNNLCKLRPELKNKGITICASRDLPLDTLIYIDGIGECIIKDRMNIRYKGTNRIDILLESKQEAIKFGIKELNYKVITSNK